MEIVKLRKVFLQGPSNTLQAETLTSKPWVPDGMQQVELWQPLHDAHRLRGY
jgi:hypothetical protein